MVGTAGGGGGHKHPPQYSLACFTQQGGGVGGVATSVLVITIHRLMFPTDGGVRDGGWGPSISNYHSPANVLHRWGWGGGRGGGGSISYYHSLANVLHTSGAGGWGGGSPTATSAQVITIHRLMFPTDGDGGGGWGGGGGSISYYHSLANISHTLGAGGWGGGHQQPRQHKLLSFTG